MGGRAERANFRKSRRRNVAPNFEFEYDARVLTGHERTTLGVESRPGGDVCLRLPQHAPNGGAADDDPSRYSVVLIQNHFARYPLAVHLYDLGPARGLRVVGLERLEQTLAELEKK